MVATDHASQLNRAMAFLSAIDDARGVSAVRSKRRGLSREVRTAPAQEVRDLGLAVVAAGQRWPGYEILSDRNDVLQSMTALDVEQLGNGLADWASIDAYGILLAGPAWKAGVLSDQDIVEWTRSDNLWRRRAALVATVVWNSRSRGGCGDRDRTLAVCERLVNDREDMVVKAMSWALRALVTWDRSAVEAFLDCHEAVLAARINREVRNKLITGRKAGRA